MSKSKLTSVAVRFRPKTHRLAARIVRIKGWKMVQFAEMATQALIDSDPDLRAKLSPAAPSAA